MMQMHPYIVNINEDAQLSGVVKLFIQEGSSVFIFLCAYVLLLLLFVCFRYNQFCL